MADTTSGENVLQLFLSVVEGYFQEWLAARGTTGASEIEQGIDQVRGIIERDGASRFVPWELPSSVVHNRLGFIRKEGPLDAPTKVTLYIMSKAWQELCRGFNPSRVAQALVDWGVLAPGAEGKTSQPVTLPDLGKTRCYILDVGTGHEPRCSQQNARKSKV